MTGILFLFLSWGALAVDFDWQGHRGARGLYPENTIGAMEEALKYPVTTLELDVVISKDHVVVVSHEPWMNEDICLDQKKKALKGKKHNLYQMTLGEIQSFDCGLLGNPKFPSQKKVSATKPSLTDLLSVTEKKLKELDKSGVSYNIEIKSSEENEQKGLQPDYKTFSELVLKSIKDKLPVSRFTIQSFDWRVLKYVHEKHIDVMVVALKEDKYTPEKVIKELGFRPFGFSPFYKLLTKEHVKHFHEMGVKVIPWTVNEQSEMAELRMMGVDGLITDYPNRIPQL